MWPAGGHPIYRIPSRVAPWKDDFEEAILRHAIAYGFAADNHARRRLIASHNGELAARTYLNATPAQREVIAGWFTWIFFYDDFYDGPIGHQEDGHRSLMEDMLAALPLQPASTPATQPANNPLARVLRDTWEAATSLPITWRLRFYQHIHGFLASFRYESMRRARHQVPPMNYFRQIRRPASCVPACLDLLEYAGGAEVPPLIYHTDQFRTLHTITVDVVSWLNDAASLRKEEHAGDVNNAILIMRNDYSCTTQHAIDLIHAKVADDIITFFRTETELDQLCRDWTGLTPAEHAAVTDCVNGTKNWMRGSLDWSRQSARYPQT